MCSIGNNGANARKGFNVKIAVCSKFTPDTEDINPAPDGSVNTKSAVWNVNDYDLQAIQAAEDMSGEDDEVVAITAGAENVSQAKLVKNLMAHGNLACLYRVADNALEDADPAVIAHVLASVIRKVEPDVVLFGEGTSDRYSRTMGALVAAELDWPSVNYADKISMESGNIVVERDLEDGIEVVELNTPCAISVTSTINIPPLLTMKAMLGAGKKPVEDLTLEELGIDTQPLLEVEAREIPARPGRQQIMLEGTPEEATAELVNKLKADQVL